MQHEIALAEARLRSARGLLLQTLDEAWDSVLAEVRLPLEHRMAIRLALTYATHQAQGGGDHLAAREWCQVAGDACCVWSVVDGYAALQPLVSPWCLGAPAALAQERGGGATLGMTFLNGSNIRAHRCAAGAAKKGGASAERDAGGALGRSRGGFGTKAVALADSHGRVIAFVLASGQAHEAPVAPALLDALPDTPLWE